MKSETDLVVTVREISERYGVTVAGVRAAAARGAFPSARKSGDTWLIARRDAEKFYNRSGDWLIDSNGQWAVSPRRGISATLTQGGYWAISSAAIDPEDEPDQWAEADYELARALDRLAAATGPNTSPDLVAAVWAEITGGSDE